MNWWSSQIEVAESVATRKKTMVLASHGVGKTHLGGGLVNWHFDCFAPSLTLSTAPTAAQVEDLLWKEVRAQRKGRPGLLPKAPRMEYSESHYAVGYTARDADSFQGRHEVNLLMLFDEATGVESPFWDGAEGMVVGEQNRWVCFLNPTDIASRAYMEAASGDWHIISICALNHPNIAAELKGEKPPFPGAVALEWVLERIGKWCDPMPLDSVEPGYDFEFPPGSGQWYRPGPEFEGRVLGRFPRQATNAVWSEADWMKCLIQQRLNDQIVPVIGCDVARYGDDNTEIFVRKGSVVVHYEYHNGWSTTATAKRLKELADMFTPHPWPSTSTVINVDDDGVGGGVVDNKGDYNFVPLSAQSVAVNVEDYPQVRDEAWFCGRDKARTGQVDLTRMSTEDQNSLRVQLMATTWELTHDGKRKVEQKKLVKKKIKRSPDTADAFNLCFYEPIGMEVTTSREVGDRFWQGMAGEESTVEEGILIG